MHTVRLNLKNGKYRIESGISDPVLSTRVLVFVALNIANL